MDLTPDRDPDHDDLAELFTALADASCAAERSLLEEEVIRRYRPMARRLTNRYANRGAELEDLAAVADLAMLKAIRRFDGDRGSFPAFATATILGEIKKYFRDCCWTIRPTRRVQELQAHIAGATEALLRDRGTSGVAEVAAALDVSVEDVREAMSARGHFTPSSLDAPVERADRTLGSTVPTTEPGFELVEDRVTAATACADLAHDDRELIQMRFFEDRTQQEIADLIGTSQMQVSRRLRRILDQLHDRVSEPDALVERTAG